MLLPFEIRTVAVNDAPENRQWWSTPLASLQSELRSTATGLTSAEARARLKRFGRNALLDRRERPLLIEFLRRFRNPLVLILLAASAVAAVVGEVASFYLISAMVALSVTLDFAQEYRAGRAADRLRKSVQVHARVLRDGAEKDVAMTHVVPGDVVVLAAGSLVPADARLLRSRDLYVNQSLLTGESFPIEKHAVDLDDAKRDLPDASNAVFMGTSVISGTATAIVCRTGTGTALGEIARTLHREPPPTAFELGARRFGMLIMRLTVLMVLFVLMVNALTHKPLLESFLFAIALAVGLTPELLPMIVSVTLARGALRMADRQVIVKRLAAIQNLGSMDVLCTDKTGTLTEMSLQVERHVDLANRDSARVLRMAWLNSRFETGLKSPLDEAILAHRSFDVDGVTKIDEVPFDFERRRLSVLVDERGCRQLIVKGAPEEMLSISSQYQTDGEAAPRPLDATARTQAHEALETMSRAGLRVLGVAYKDVAGDHVHAGVTDESGLVFVGFVAFLDPPKATAREALAALAKSGVAVKILTGDSDLVTQHLCGGLGIPVTGMLTGAEIARLDDHALQASVDSVNLFCRVSPAQKNRILLALKARGRVVGFLGDGVNDAPALHVADVGLSVSSAVDVAKEAADMIMKKRDLRVLHEGVLEGRRTFANIRKYILMGTSSNFGNMFSMAGASLFLPFLPMLPTQILLNNVLYDLSELPIPLDRVESEELRRPQAFDMTFIRNFMWTMGPLSSLFDFLTFLVLLAVLHADEALFQTGWFIESLATQVLVIFVIRTPRSPLAGRPHPALTATSLAVVAAALLLPFSGIGRYFGMTPPPAGYFGILLVLVVIYLAAAEVAKRVFYARYAVRVARKGAEIARG